MIKLQIKNNNDIKRGITKISALSSGIIDKHECVTGEKIFPYGPLNKVELE